MLKIKNHSIVGILLIYSLILVLLFLNKINSSPTQIPSWDESHHLVMGYNYFERFMKQDWNAITQIFKHSNQIYPPLYHILISISYYFFGVSITSALYLNSLFIPLLIFSTYSLGKSIFNEKVGFISAIITPILPMFLYLPELAYIDYISITLFISSFAVIFKTNYLKNTKYTLLLGFILFLQIITKWPFVIPSIPIVVYFIHSISKSKNPDKHVWKNTLYMLIFITVGLVWYHFNIEYIIKGLSFFWDPNGVPQIMWNNADRWSFKNLLLYIYPYATSGEGMGTIPLLFFISSLLIKGKKNFYSGYITASILVTFLTLTYLNDKDPKYLGYVYPFIMIYIVGKYTQIRIKIVRDVAIFIFVISIVLNFIWSQFDTKDYNDQEQYKLLPGYNKVIKSTVWPTEHIVTDEAFHRCKNSLLVLSDTRYLNPVNVQYYFKSHSKNTYINSGYNLYNPTKSNFENFRLVNNYNCIISKSGYIGVFANRNVVDLFENYIESINTFNRIEFQTPDKSIITLYYAKD